MKTWIALGVLLALIAPACRAGGAHAPRFPPPESAVATAFPGATVTRRTWALTASEAARVRALAGSALDSRLIAGWVVTRDGAPAGLALLDAHEVRSKRETLLISMDEGFRVLRVDVLAFAEPPEYLATPRWLEQFSGRALDDDLAVKREIRGITGATLTARAATDAVRRSLAVAQVLAERAAAPLP